MQRIQANGYLRAEADQTHPLQTRLSLILTDFEPNGNRQAVPKAEAENIIRTALNQPIKINFTGDGFTGHTGAIPIGPIVHAFASEDKGREVIKADGIIWNEVYGDISEHIKHAFSEGIGTSWEIYFEKSEKDSNGVEWLNGCIFGGTCIVEVPAYGPERTRILAVAEALQNTPEMITMAKEEPVVAEDNMDETRQQLLDAQDLLFKLWEGVDQLFSKTFEIEAAAAEKDIGKIAESFAEKIGKLADRIQELSAASAELDTAKAELETLKAEKAQAELDAKKAQRFASLKEIGIVVEETDAEHYISMNDVTFERYIKDLKSLKPTVAKAELSPAIVPEPLGKTDITTEDIVSALKAEFTR